MKKILARQEAKRELIEESACSGKERTCTANQAALQEYYIFHNSVEESLDQWSLCYRQLLCNRLFCCGLTEDHLEERLCSHMRPVSELTLHWCRSNSPLCCAVTAEQVAGAALALCSSLGTGITGECVHVDAGMHVVLSHSHKECGHKGTVVMSDHEVAIVMAKAVVRQFFELEWWLFSPAWFAVQERGFSHIKNSFECVEWIKLHSCSFLVEQVVAKEAWISVTLVNL